MTAPACCRCELRVYPHTVSGGGRGRRRWRMIHNWGRFGGHKTTRKWVRTLITGHIFRSPARRPTERPSVRPALWSADLWRPQRTVIAASRRAGNKLGDAIAEPLRRKAKVLYSYLNGLTYAPTRQSSGTFLFAQILT